MRKRYFAWTRATTVNCHPDLFERWRALGLDAAFLGFEFPSDEQLRKSKKGSIIAENARAHDALRSHAAGTTILRDHLVSLRSALDPARQSLSLGPLTYTDSAITAGVTPVRRQHVSELRDGVNGAQRPGAVCDPGRGSCDGSSATYCNLDGTAFLQESCDPLQGMSCSSQSGQCEGACTAASLAALPNASLGCDFYPAVTANIVDSQFSFAATVSNPNGAAVTVMITRGSDIVTSLSVAANSGAVIALPWVAPLKGPESAGFPASLVQTSGACRLRATAPITVAQFSPLESAPERSTRTRTMRRC